MSVVAEEEYRLLLDLRSVVDITLERRPALTLLTRNEILQEAQELLAGEDRERFIAFSDRLSRTLDGDSIIAFLLPSFWRIR